MWRRAVDGDGEGDGDEGAGELLSTEEGAVSAPCARPSLLSPHPAAISPTMTVTTHVRRSEALMSNPSPSKYS